VINVVSARRTKQIIEASTKTQLYPFVVSLSNHTDGQARAPTTLL